MAVFMAVFIAGQTLRAQVDASPTPAGAMVSEPEPADAAATVEEESAQDSSADTPWYERIRFSGDFRSRYEGFYQADRENRNRARLRLRLRVDTDLNEDARFHLQVASGDPGTPVSTNQTFTSFFRPKPFNLDRAYIAYNPQVASALTLGIGKFGFPQNRTQMIFDDDLNFEGGWEQVSWDLSEGVGINLVALQTAVTELPTDNDTFMLAAYGELSFDGSRADFGVSVANYSWANPDPIVMGHTADVLKSILTNDLMRNSAGEVVGFASGFNVVDVIAETTIRTARPDYPIRLLADLAYNTRAANERDRGFWVEAEYGSPRAVNTWGATYTYGWIEQDVSPSAFVFSDILSTNIRLHMIETSYIPKSGLSLDVTLHLTKRVVVLEGTPNDLLARLHVAIVARF